MPNVDATDRTHSGPGRIVAPVIWIAVLLSGCSEPAPEPPLDADRAPPAVLAVPAREESVQAQAAFVGRVMAADRVELRARVEGFLKERLVNEGERVDVDQIVFRIEPDQYRSVVSQREADLAAAIADQENASAQLTRGEELLASKNIPASKVDELRAAESIATARIKQAEAALEAARLNLAYTEIRSPIEGRIGLARYSVGNLVGPSSEPLAVVVSTDPIEVRFPITQRELLEAKKEAQAAGAKDAEFEVLALLPDDSLYTHPGRIDFVDVLTDAGTDTVTLRSLFPNPEGLLVDGQYVRVLLQRTAPDLAITVPQSALQIDQQGTYVLIVDADSRVAIRRIQTGPLQGAAITVTSGLKLGDLVITDGAQKVRPGMRVSASPPQVPEGFEPPASSAATDIDPVPMPAQEDRARPAIEATDPNAAPAAPIEAPAPSGDDA